MKIKLDQYYTPKSLAKDVVNKTIEITKANNFIEPSAGTGVFLEYLPKNTIAMDIDPKADNILKLNFLEYDGEYEENLCVIGNPPFGERGVLCKKFCEKSFELGDWVSFILPVNQLDNDQSIYKFDLIYSENLGIHKFSEYDVHVCHNIYKRPKFGPHKTKIKYSHPKIKINEIRKNSKPPPRDYDISICGWGSIGKIAQPGQYAKQFYISCPKHIANFILEYDWKSRFPSAGTPNLLQWQIQKVCLEKFPDSSVGLENFL